MTAPRVASAIAGVAVVLVLAACGIDTDGADTERQEFVEARAVEQEELRDFREQTAELPPRPAGEVAIAGETPDSLTAGAVDQFNIASTGIDVYYDPVGATGAFDALCEGAGSTSSRSRGRYPRLSLPSARRMESSWPRRSRWRRTRSSSSPETRAMSAATVSESPTSRRSSLGARRSTTGFNLASTTCPWRPRDRLTEP